MPKECDAKQVIQSWPMEAKKAADMAMQKYGEPDEVTSARLVWNDNGPWKRTIITKEETDHAFPMPHKDVMEQVIDYKVPPDKFDELAEYDGSVIAERTKGELSARCDKEEANLLALNLANDVATGKKSAGRGARVLCACDQGPDGWQEGPVRAETAVQPAATHGRCRSPSSDAAGNGQDVTNELTDTSRIAGGPGQGRRRRLRVAHVDSAE